jgi:hypothetical protein
MLVMLNRSRPVVNWWLERLIPWFDGAVLSQGWKGALPDLHQA